MRLFASCALAVVLAACSADTTPGVAAPTPEPDVGAPDVVDWTPPPDVADAAVDDVAHGTDASDLEGFGPCVAGDEPGCPCTDNSGCETGFCVDAPSGKVCSLECIENCPPGWTCSAVPGTGTDTLFICVAQYTNLCRPCRINEDCGGEGARCLPRSDGAGSFCGTACDGVDDCPPAYACESRADVSGDETEQCVLVAPGAGAGDDPVCTCNGKAVFDGASTDCTISNVLGTCGGARACGANGLSSCDAPIAVEEVCNAADDDCDGSVDEDEQGGVLEVACETTTEYGTCAGSRVCVQGALTPCDAPEATLEVCDGLDNNCSGAVDDDLGTLECGLGVCAQSLDACVAGVAQQCDPLLGATDEACNSLDDDCDGATDENLGEVSCGEGQCAHTVPACVAGEVQVCNPFEGGKSEACDLLDNDCDGEIDEALGDTACGLGACSHVVPNCVLGEVQFCNPFDGAIAELCNALDDDCDGQTDEGLGAVTCGEGQCLHTVAACDEGTPIECDPLEGAVDEVCNGLDDDCDGDTDETLGTVLCGQGQCAQTLAACEAGQPAVCNPFAGATPEVCDGVDNDCDGQTDEELGTVVCGVGKCAQLLPACQAGAPPACDPLLGAVAESCNGVDDDCDGAIDDDLAELECGQGVCQHSVAACSDGQPNSCDPLAGAQAEVCDGQDNDCDGATDEELTPTLCGVGECEHLVSACEAGAPGTCNPFEGALPEACDELDNDCDGETDESLGDLTCGLGECVHTVPACVAGQAGACDPLEGAEAEACNDLDDDCDGVTDEGACAPTRVEVQFDSLLIESPAGSGFTITGAAGSGACGLMANGTGFSVKLGLPLPGQ